MAKMAHFYFTRDSDMEVSAFVVDPEYKDSDQFLGLPLMSIDQIQDKYPASDYKAFVALSYTDMNRDREKKFHTMKKMGYSLASYISSRCTYLSDDAPGENCLILENNMVQPFTTIGHNNFIWCGNIIGHETRVGDHCFFAGGDAIAGHSIIQNNCFLGPNVTIKNGVTLRPFTLATAGSVILKNTKEYGVYYPEKTKILRKRSIDLKL